MGEPETDDIENLTVHEVLMQSDTFIAMVTSHGKAWGTFWQELKAAEVPEEVAMRAMLIYMTEFAQGTFNRTIPAPFMEFKHDNE